MKLISTAWISRLLGFAGCLVGAAVCFFVAFITLPLLPIKCVIMTIRLGSCLIILADRRSLLLHSGNVPTFSNNTTSSDFTIVASGASWLCLGEPSAFVDTSQWCWSCIQVLCADWTHQPHKTSSLPRAASFLSHIFLQPGSYTLLLSKCKFLVLALEFYNVDLLNRHDRILDPWSVGLHRCVC
jgi:hypothetical protein